MSVAICREVNRLLRAAGVVVREWPDWESRGNGLTSAYEGGIVHHTATAFGVALPSTGVGRLLVNGRSDLQGPLCNYAGNDDGSITVIAAHPANHAGASGGRSMGPLPVTSLFNRRVLGLEIVYPGTQPMRTAQYRSALVWANAVAAVCGRGDIQRIRAHAETSVTGKWDPGQASGVTINMAAFRTAARVISHEEDDLREDERLWLYRLYLALVTGEYHNTYKTWPQFNQDLGTVRNDIGSVGRQVAAVQGAISAQEARILAAVAADGTHPVDVTELADALITQLGPDLGDALLNALATHLNRNREGN